MPSSDSIPPPARYKPVLYDFRKLAEAETDIVDLYAVLVELLRIIGTAQDRMIQTRTVHN